MEWVETTGRTIEEAKDAALDQLGVDETDAEFVVVTEPRAGLFGRMRGEARVRARVRPTSPRPKRTRTRRQGEQREGARRGGGSARSGSKGPAGGGAGAVAVADGEAGSDQPAADGSTEKAVTETGGTRSRNRRSRSRGGGGRSGQGDAAGTAGAAGESEEGAATPPRSSTRGRGSRSAGSTKEETVGEVLSLEEQGESARGFVAGLIDELGMDATVSTRIVDDETAEVVVDGQELGVLIGPGGATLGALQELARTFVQKRTGGQSSRIVVDVAGYRAKRVAALQRFTRQIADEIRASGTERALEPMSASDRKVVHDAINEVEGLSTRSEGEDPRRYIVISPQGGTPVEADEAVEADGADEAVDTDEAD